jgi:hypothetical protein
VNLSQTIQAIQKTLVRHSPAYAAGRARAAHDSPLAAHDSPLSAAKALDGVSECDEGPRGVLAAAILEEHRQHPACPLWQSLLVVGFAPMLQRIRDRFGKKLDFDLDQTVLLAFLEALRSPALDRVRPAASLKAATEDALKALRRGTLGKADTGSFDETVHGVKEAPPEEAEDVRRALEGLDRKGLDLLLRTLLGGESLDEYVRRVHGALDEDERRALCERLRKARSRLVTELRARLSAA